MAIVWENVHEFYDIMIMHSTEQNFDLTYSWKKIT